MTLWTRSNPNLLSTRSELYLQTAVDKGSIMVSSYNFSTLGPRQKDCHEFEASAGCTANLVSKNNTQNKQKPHIEVSIQAVCISQPLIGAICGHSRREGGTEVLPNKARIPGAGAGPRGFAGSRVFVSRHLSAWSVNWAGQSGRLGPVSWGRWTGAPWWVLPAGSGRGRSSYPPLCCARTVWLPEAYAGLCSRLLSPPVSTWAEPPGRLVLSRTRLLLVQTPVPLLLFMASPCPAVTALGARAARGVGWAWAAASPAPRRLLLCWLSWAGIPHRIRVLCLCCDYVSAPNVPAGWICVHHTPSL